MGKQHAFSLKHLARMFVDFDRASSQEWDRKHTEEIAALAEHFEVPPEFTVIDILREAMAVVLHTGEPLVIGRK